MLHTTPYWVGVSVYTFLYTTVGDFFYPYA